MTNKGLTSENSMKALLNQCESLCDEAKGHKDLDVALDLYLEAYGLLEDYFNEMREKGTKIGDEVVSDKEYADFSGLYYAVCGGLKGIAESGFPEFSADDLPEPLDGFEDVYED